MAAKFRETGTRFDLGFGAPKVRAGDFAGLVVAAVGAFEAKGEVADGRPKSDFTSGGANLDLALMADLVRLAASPKLFLIELPAD